MSRGICAEAKISGDCCSGSLRGISEKLPLPSARPQRELFAATKYKQPQKPVGLWGCEDRLDDHPCAPINTPRPPVVTGVRQNVEEEVARGWLLPLFLLVEDAALLADLHHARAGQDYLGPNQLATALAGSDRLPHSALASHLLYFALSHL